MTGSRFNPTLTEENYELDSAEISEGRGRFTLSLDDEENKLLITDADTISEISTFIEKKGSYEADEGYHDDLVMPLVLFGWLTTQPYFKDLNNINLRTIMYEKQIQAIEDELTPFGFYDDGNGDKEPLNF